MKQKKLGMFRRDVLQKECSELLGNGAVRITLIQASLICFSPLILFFTLNTLFGGLLIPAMGVAGELIYWGVLALLALFLLLPLWMSLVRMAALAEAGESIYLIDVFHAYSKGAAYRTALCGAWALFWRGAILILVEEATLRLFAPLAAEHFIMYLLCVLVMIGAAVLWIIPALKGFLAVYGTVRPSQGLARMRPYARSLAIGYWKVFFPWLVLSLLTFGVLFLADTLPRMLIAYFRLCRKLNEKITQSEEI